MRATVLTKLLPSGEIDPAEFDTFFDIKVYQGPKHAFYFRSCTIQSTENIVDDSVSPMTIGSASANASGYNSPSTVAKRSVLRNVVCP